MDARDALPILWSLARVVNAHLRSLTRLHAVCTVDEESNCIEVSRPLRDAVVLDSSIVRMALLSVLRVGGCALPDVARAVLARSGAAYRSPTANLMMEVVAEESGTAVVLYHGRTLSLIQLLGLVSRALAKLPRPEKLPDTTCPICKEKLTPPKRRDNMTTVTLACGHAFCRDCARPYVTIKVRERRVEWDELVCPVVECNRSLHDADLRVLLDDSAFQQYKRTLARVRLEKHPLTRWCLNPQCGELIVGSSPSAKTFTCPSCATVGCFRCRGPPHRFAFLCRAQVAEDASFTLWLKSVGDRRAVRPCPHCQIQIWKTEGCNHMTCARCRHEFCWVCRADWTRDHYACTDGQAKRRALAAILQSCWWLLRFAVWCAWSLVRRLDVVDCLVVSLSIGLVMTLWFCNILLNLAHDPIMAVPRVMILLTIFFSFPLLFHPLRCLVLEMQWCCGAQPTLLTQFIVSVLLMVLQLLVATRVPGIQVVFSFVDSSILLVLCYAMVGGSSAHQGVKQLQQTSTKQS